MKRLAVFIAVLLSSIITACGYYPYGEDLRFSFLNPKNFPYRNYASFYYSALGFTAEPEVGADIRDNEELWKKYCGNKASLEDIEDVLNNYSYSDIGPDRKNSFLKYLYAQKDTEAINYLKFAKNCEYFNTWQDDPWERNDKTADVKRKDLIEKAVSFAKSSRNMEIRKRYAFLAVRLAFYQEDMKILNQIYNQYFSVDKTDTVIDVWALYFKAVSEDNPGLKNLYLAKVFALSPAKRFVAWQLFVSKLPQEETLKYAKNNAEKSAVLLMYGIYNPEKNLENLKKMYAVDAGAEGLSFLLLRETSKLEDWIYTPYYSLFEPAIRQNYFTSDNDPESQSIQRILKRTETDREYAGKVLEFINAADLSKVENPEFWKFVKAELMLMIRNYSGSLEEIAGLEKILPVNSEIRGNLELIKALNLFARQEPEKAIIPEETKKILLKNKHNKYFIFALGRELEYLGNTDDAALLYVSLDTSHQNDYFSVFYKSLKNTKKTFTDYYADYFDYFDAVYTSGQLKSFLSKAETLSKSEDPFYRNYHPLKQTQMNELYDLLGTKYIRENQLQPALAVFQKLGEDYFDGQSALWEREKEDNKEAGKIFSENPFYELKYTPDFIDKKEEFRLNKISITKKLIEYINRAENINEKDRDYYYFLVANCYYNMSQYGNAWMMKRYNLSSSGNFSVREDNEEFNTANLAKLYYGKALEQAKTEKFKALCLRMQGRCENYKLDFKQEEAVDYFYASEGYEEDRLQSNIYYQDLARNYGDYYSDMMSGCDSFAKYFKARR